MLETWRRKRRSRAKATREKRKRTQASRKIRRRKEGKGQKKSGGLERQNQGREAQMLEMWERRPPNEQMSKEEGGVVLTNGGRVIAVTTLDNDRNHAIQKSMLSIESIDFAGKYYRKDIGFDL